VVGKTSTFESGGRVEIRWQQHRYQLIDEEEDSEEGGNEDASQHDWYKRTERKETAAITFSKIEKALQGPFLGPNLKYWPQRMDTFFDLALSGY
jgi:hypothetical protein